MASTLISYLCNRPFVKVVKGLYYSHRACHLRELARCYDLSPGGVSDILRRLKELNLVEVQYIKNRSYYSLSLSTNEYELFKDLFKSFEKSFIAERVPQLEHKAIQKLEWMDEAYRFLKKVKQKNVDATSSLKASR